MTTSRRLALALLGLLATGCDSDHPERSQPASGARGPDTVLLPPDGGGLSSDYQPSLPGVSRAWSPEDLRAAPLQIEWAGRRLRARSQLWFDTANFDRLNATAVLEGVTGADASGLLEVVRIHLLNGDDRWVSPAPLVTAEEEGLHVTHDMRTGPEGAVWRFPRQGVDLILELDLDGETVLLRSPDRGVKDLLDAHSS